LELIDTHQSALHGDLHDVVSIRQAAGKGSREPAQARQHRDDV
jgi:hypothetical protein